MFKNKNTNTNSFLCFSITLGTALTTTLIASSAHATPFTTTSPITGNSLVTGTTEIGGVVLELKGANNALVTSQVAASTLFVGFCDTGTPVAFQGNPCTIGIQTGFDASIINALGGGLSEAAVRFTLFDGDTALGDFDYNANDLYINGIFAGNWSDVQAQNTDSVGNAGGAGFSGGGFRNDLLDTGFFHITDQTTLDNIYGTLDPVTSGEVVFALLDTSFPFDNFFDFTQGIDGGLIEIGQPPVVTPTGTPEPNSILGLLSSVILGFGIKRIVKYS